MAFRAKQGDFVKFLGSCMVSCSGEVAAYGACVTSRLDGTGVKKGCCDKEFLALRDCTRAQLKKVRKT